jgi:GNAT superfamily N-acetyltransferase
MQIRLAASVAELERCFPIIVQLRPHLDKAHFIQQVQRQQQEGYRLAYLEAADQIRAVAGCRVLEKLFNGRSLYVDDLVTDEHSRSQGYGEALFHWLIEYGRSHNCQQLELDSGVQRSAAHRFYFRQRMVIASYHFALPL